ncbi:hypothetical protein ACFLZY_02590 [Patescibacteria group bacterium]
MRKLAFFFISILLFSCSTSGRDCLVEAVVESTKVTAELEMVEDNLKTKPVIENFLNRIYEPTGQKIPRLTLEIPQCQPLPSEGFKTDTYVVAQAVKWLLMSDNLDHRQTGHSILNNNFSADLAFQHETKVFSRVFCGSIFEAVVRGMIFDAFVNNQYNDKTNWKDTGWRMRVQELLSGLGLVKFAEAHFKKEISQEQNQFVLIHLISIWIAHELSQMSQKDIQEKKHELFGRIRKMIPNLDHLQVVQKALNFYEDRVRPSCKCIEAVFVVSGGLLATPIEVRESESFKQKLYFSNPSQGCPTEQLLKEMNLDSCPLQPPS